MNLYVSEELRCGKFFWDGATVDGNERLTSTLAELMDTVGYIFLTRSTGTIDQYRHRGGGNQSYIIIELFGCITLSFQIVGRRSVACISLMGTFSFPEPGLVWEKQRVVSQPHLFSLEVRPDLQAWQRSRWHLIS